MKTKSLGLVAALACLSVVAVAQQSGSTQKPSSKTTSATTAQGAASSDAAAKGTGKKGYDNYQGNKTAQDHWDARVAAGSNTNQNGSSSGNASAGQATVVRESPSKGSLSAGHASLTKANTSVSAGDVNGDGRADKAASGQTTGKRQHQPIAVTKTTDVSSPK